jgi:hypothetical protein
LEPAAANDDDDDDDDYDDNIDLQKCGSGLEITFKILVPSSSATRF